KSPFEVVYRQNPISHLDLVPALEVGQFSEEGADQSKQIKELHRSEGDLVWIYLRKERFLAGRLGKLKSRRDGPFCVLKKINDNTYKIELSGHYNVSTTFNVADLSPYKGDSDDEPDSGSSLFQEREDDVDAVNDLDDPNGVLYGSSSGTLYQVNLSRPCTKNEDTVSLTVGTDPTIGLRRENQMVRDSVQLETAVNTISHEYLLEFTSEYGISEVLHPELPGPGERIVDFPEGKLETAVNTISHEYLLEFTSEYDGMPASGTYSVEAVRVLDTHRTPIQKQPEALLCLVGISRRYYLGDDVYPTFHYDDDREIDLFSLIRAPNPTKVKTGSRPRAPYELPLLTLTAPRVIKMDEPAAATDSSGVPSAIERSPLNFADEAEASGRETAVPEMPPLEEVPSTTAPGGNQAAETVAVEPPAVR
nr:hypothetical protein [Tanacetum cinerariifolium]